MTTNCGLFKPDDRAIRVKSGGNSDDGHGSAETMVAQGRFATGIRELAASHTISVANEPHVPGAGIWRRSPRRQKSRDQRAQSGAAARFDSAVAGGTPAPRSRYGSGNREA